MKRMTYLIDQEKCTSCGLCLKDCPSGAIKNIEGKMVLTEKRCIHCGHCGAVCPEGAISCNGEELDLIPESNLNEDDIFHFLTGKRSVRRYKNETLSQDVLDKILKVGALTATASNTQDVRVSLFKGEEVVTLTSTLCRELLRLIKKFNNPAGRMAARIMGLKNYSSKKVLGAFERKLNEGIVGKEDPLFFNAPIVINVTYPKKNKRFGRTNSVLAGQNMMLYAHSLGIESCMIGFAELAGKGKKGRQSLKIENSRRSGVIFTLGYGVPKYHRLPVRKPLVD